MTAWTISIPIARPPMTANAIRRDPDSLAPFTKAACDALVRCGYLIDDSAVWITRIQQQILIDRTNPRIEIRIATTPSEESQ